MPNQRELAERADFYKNGLDCENNCRKKGIADFKRERRLNDPACADNKWRLNHWNKHRQRVDTAIPNIYSKCPKFHPFHFTKSNTTYKQRLQTFVRIEIENTLLTKHLEQIFTGKNQLDNELDPLLRRTNCKAKSRFMQQLKWTKENAIIARNLIKVHPTMSRRKQLEWYSRQELCMEKLLKFPLYWKSRLCEPFENFAVMNASDDHKPRVYFDLQVRCGESGRVVIELYSKMAPIAVESFRSLCNGESFKCCKVDKIWPGMYYRLGRGAKGSHGPFPPKNFKMKHDDAGIVTLINNGENLFDAEFMIIARELKPLNGQNLAIGKVIQGLEFLRSLEKYIRPDTMSPTNSIDIIKTGELNSDYNDDEQVEEEEE